MQLGDLFARLEDESTAMEALLATGDLSLVVRVQAAATAEGAPVGEYMGELIGRFSAQAAPDQWVAVMSAANRAEAPGGACLRSMLSAALGQLEAQHGATPPTS